MLHGVLFIRQLALHGSNYCSYLLKKVCSGVFHCTKLFTCCLPAEFWDSVKLAIPTLLAITMTDDIYDHVVGVQALVSLAMDGVLNASVF